MYVIGVDFAARFSGAVLMSPEKDVLTSWVIDAQSAEKPPRLRNHIPAIRDFVISAQRTVKELGVNDQTLYVVENVSHFMVNPAPVLRLQGVLEDWLMMLDAAEPEWVMPNIWQNYYGFAKSSKVKKVPSTKVQSKNLCKEFGYEFDLTGKSKTDLYDASLIARWKLETM